jgi:L-iditol 2-dehydrogenase
MTEKRSMLAAVYHGPHDLRVERIPVPQIGPDELLLQVKSASICGTDLRIFHGGHRMLPAGTVRVPGHEVVGVISSLGSEVDGLAVGQTVFIAPNMGCGHCRQCISGNNNRCASYQALGVTIDGGFAEYMRVPAAAIKSGNVMPVNETVDPAVAALIEPFACVLRGQDVLNIRPGDIVLVIGAGPIGLMHAKLAQLRGAGKVLVSETNPERTAQALTLGADRVVNPALEDLSAVIAEESSGMGADVIIVAAPAHAAQEAALQYAAIGGRINFFGGLPKDRSSINFDSNLVHYKELLVTATTACSTSDCRRSAQIISTGKVDLSSLISHRFPLTAALPAFAAAEDRKSLKVVLEP